MKHSIQAAQVLASRVPYSTRLCRTIAGSLVVMMSVLFATQYAAAQVQVDSLSRNVVAKFVSTASGGPSAALGQFQNFVSSGGNFGTANQDTTLTLNAQTLTGSGTGNIAWIEDNDPQDTDRIVTSTLDLKFSNAAIFTIVGLDLTTSSDAITSVARLTKVGGADVFNLTSPTADFAFSAADLDPGAAYQFFVQANFSRLAGSPIAALNEAASFDLGSLTITAPTPPPTAIPLPAAAWTGLAGLLGLGVFSKKLRKMA